MAIEETELISFFADDKSGKSHEYQINLLDAFTAISEFRFWLSVIKTAKDLDNFEGIFMEKISDDNFIKHISILFTNVIKDGKQITNLKEEYRGEPIEMIMVIVHILKYNFEDLWSGKLQEAIKEVIKP